MGIWFIYFQIPTCTRDFPGTDFLIFRYSGCELSGTGPVIFLFFCSNLAVWNEIFSKIIFICILTPKDLLWPAQASLFPNFRPFFLSENRKP